MEKVIVVFDGFCVLCNNYVRWVSKRNPSKNIYFTNFDSNYIKNNYPKLKLGDTIFIITDDNKILLRSEAIKYSFKYIRLNYFLKTLIRISPNFLLDIFYRLIASNRYFLFGKLEVCSTPNDVNQENILF
jgi:predicted DCC family thiol-disulfide oxidoreductase YuxK|tara:strand:+ start:2889 stop:3278 length:390 start_codon:yes stop_codon:yes gene_type:complete